MRSVAAGLVDVAHRPNEGQGVSRRRVCAGCRAPLAASNGGTIVSATGTALFNPARDAWVDHELIVGETITGRVVRLPRSSVPHGGYLFLELDTESRHAIRERCRLALGLAGGFERGTEQTEPLLLRRVELEQDVDLGHDSPIDR